MEHQNKQRRLLRECLDRKPKLPKTDDGASVLTNENPLDEPPGWRSDDAEDAVHWMAYPSPEPACVIKPAHPVGAVMLPGELARKSSPGTQANQNVPIDVEPVSCRVTVYCK